MSLDEAAVWLCVSLVIGCAALAALAAWVAAQAAKHEDLAAKEAESRAFIKSFSIHQN